MSLFEIPVTLKGPKEKVVSTHGWVSKLNPLTLGARINGSSSHANVSAQRENQVTGPWSHSTSPSVRSLQSYKGDCSIVAQGSEGAPPVPSSQLNQQVLLKIVSGSSIINNWPFPTFSIPHANWNFQFIPRPPSLLAFYSISFFLESQSTHPKSQMSMKGWCTALSLELWFQILGERSRHSWWMRTWLLDTTGVTGWAISQCQEKKGSSLRAMEVLLSMQSKHTSFSEDPSLDYYSKNRISSQRAPKWRGDLI